jgi:general secretion pathway protein G
MGVLKDRLGRELSRFETAMVVIVIGGIASVLLARVDALFARVEEARMRATLTRLTSDLQMEVATRIMQGRDATIADLAGSNPLALGDAIVPLSLRSRTEDFAIGPRGYGGELGDPESRRVPGGTWYFDRDERLLVYRVENERHFFSEVTGPKRARFRVTLRFDDRDGDGRYTRGVDRIRTVALVPVEAYEWR